MDPGSKNKKSQILCLISVFSILMLSVNFVGAQDAETGQGFQEQGQGLFNSMIQDISNWLEEQTISSYSLMLVMLKLNPCVYPENGNTCEYDAEFLGTIELPRNVLIRDSQMIFLKTLMPMYVLLILFLGIYLIMSVGTPRGRMKTKELLFELMTGMVIVSLSPILLQFILDVSSWMVEQMFDSIGANYETDIFTSIWEATTSQFLVAIVILAFATVALLMVTFRFILIMLFAAIFPLTLFLYYFSYTRGLGNSLLKFTYLAIFIQVIQALFVVIAVAGLQDSGVGFLLTAGGLLGVVLSPLFMMKLSSWFGAVVHAYSTMGGTAGTRFVGFMLRGSPVGEALAGAAGQTFMGQSMGESARGGPSAAPTGARGPMWDGAAMSHLYWGKHGSEAGFAPSIYPQGGDKFVSTAERSYAYDSSTGSISGVGLSVLQRPEYAPSFGEIISGNKSSRTRNEGDIDSSFSEENESGRGKSQSQSDYSVVYGSGKGRTLRPSYFNREMTMRAWGPHPKGRFTSQTSGKPTGSLLTRGGGIGYETGSHSSPGGSLAPAAVGGASLGGAGAEGGMAPTPDVKVDSESIDGIKPFQRDPHTPERTPLQTETAGTGGEPAPGGEISGAGSPAAAKKGEEERKQLTPEQAKNKAIEQANNRLKNARKAEITAAKKGFDSRIDNEEDPIQKEMEKAQKRGTLEKIQQKYSKAEKSLPERLESATEKQRARAEKTAAAKGESGALAEKEKAKTPSTGGKGAPGKGPTTTGAPEGKVAGIPPTTTAPTGKTPPPTSEGFMVPEITDPKLQGIQAHLEGTGAWEDVRGRAVASAMNRAGTSWTMMSRAEKEGLILSELTQELRKKGETIAVAIGSEATPKVEKGLGGTGSPAKSQSFWSKLKGGTGRGLGIGFASIMMSVGIGASQPAEAFQPPKAPTGVSAPVTVGHSIVESKGDSLKMEDTLLDKGWESDSTVRGILGEAGVTDPNKSAAIGFQLHQMQHILRGPTLETREEVSVNYEDPKVRDLIKRVIQEQTNSVEILEGLGSMKQRGLDWDVPHYRRWYDDGTLEQPYHVVIPKLESILNDHPDHATEIIRWFSSGGTMVDNTFATDKFMLGREINWTDESTWKWVKEHVIDANPEMARANLSALSRLAYQLDWREMETDYILKSSRTHLLEPIIKKGGQHSMDMLLAFRSGKTRAPGSNRDIEWGRYVGSLDPEIKRWLGDQMIEDPEHGADNLGRLFALKDKYGVDWSAKENSDIRKILGNIVEKNPESGLQKQIDKLSGVPAPAGGPVPDSVGPDLTNLDAQTDLAHVRADSERDLNKVRADTKVKYDEFNWDKFEDLKEETQEWLLHQEELVGEQKMISDLFTLRDNFGVRWDVPEGAGVRGVIEKLNRVSPASIGEIMAHHSEEEGILAGDAEKRFFDKLEIFSEVGSSAGPAFMFELNKLHMDHEDLMRFNEVLMANLDRAEDVRIFMEEASSSGSNPLTYINSRLRETKKKKE
ncbi:MAG: hypothetical protein ABH950_00415 [Candidatus Altiarchaeota archaeon]